MGGLSALHCGYPCHTHPLSMSHTSPHPPTHPQVDPPTPTHTHMSPNLIFTGPDSWSQTLVTEGIAEKFIGIDFTDGETVFERCVEAIQKVIGDFLRGEGSKG